MTVVLIPRRARILWLLAVLFTLINVAGLVWAALAGEMRHALLHVVLMLLGVHLTRRLAARRAALE